MEYICSEVIKVVWRPESIPFCQSGSVSDTSFALGGGGGLEKKQICNICCAQVFTCLVNQISVVGIW